MRRSLTVWLGLLAVLFNLLPTALSADPRPLPQVGLVDDHLVICTSGGLMTVDLDGDSQPDSSVPPDRNCAFCLPLLQGAANLTQPVLLPAPALFLAKAEFSARSPLLRPAHLSRLPFSRAPPSLA